MSTSTHRVAQQSPSDIAPMGREATLPRSLNEDRLGRGNSGENQFFYENLFVDTITNLQEQQILMCVY